MNYPSYLTESALSTFIAAAIHEDIGSGDHSSLAAVDPSYQRTARLLMKSTGVIAGLDISIKIFKAIDPGLEVRLLAKDGDLLKPGDIGLTVAGKAQSILAGERLVLNCMQRMSGIATYTRHLNSLISHTSAQLLDTRKTTPNFRLMEKWAVFIGGGVNHRFGLYDMIMLKDNHIDYAGGVAKALRATQKYLEQKELDLKIEIETRNLQEVKEVLQVGGVSRIMLDNMTVRDMAKALEWINGSAETEASGGITEDTIVPVAETGVDYISVGALTHSVKSLDMSLKAV